MYPMPQCCTDEDCLKRTGWTVPHAVVTILRTENYFHMFKVRIPAQYLVLRATGSSAFLQSAGGRHFR